MSPANLVSLGGIVALLGLAWTLSADRTRMNWRVVVFGVGLQLFFALLIFQVPAGTDFFLFLNRVVVRVLDSATAGTRFLFGRLALPPGTTSETGETSLGFFLAFQALPTIVFFAALVELLYHVRVMPWLIRRFATVFTRLMRLSGAEALCVSSNVFVGIEAGLTVKPHLDTMTRSELCTILTAGMGTIASSVLALYVFILQPEFPTIAGHLVSASILAAPAAVVMSKILYPETGQPATLGIDLTPEYARASNAIAAIINGANNGVRLVVGIAALLLAFLGLVALADLAIGVVGSWLGLDLSLRTLLGWVFYPLTVAIGVPLADATAIARIIGERTVVTEVTAYQDLARLMAAGGLADHRSVVIATYALCGFAHVPSLAIFVGGLAALAPSRMTDLTELGLRALLAATLACLLTAAVAGTVYTGGSILMGTRS